MVTLIKNIQELVQVRSESVRFLRGKEMGFLPTIKNAFLVIRGGLIDRFGEMKDLPEFYPNRVIDATGRLVLPAWCDSHTHLVYAGNREDEFVDRIKGLSYEQIAQKGGGILNSAKKLQCASEEELFAQAAERIKEIMQLGTGAVEIKSGYGLTVDAEIKMLRVIKKISQQFPITVKATFLGAHAFPANYKNNPQTYIDLILTDMLPAIAEEKLATYIDVFCETGYFSADQTDRILKEGIKYGLVPKIHVNQFNSMGGIAVAIRNQALSVDHLEVMTDEDIAALKNTEVMSVALPACSFFLDIPYTPARKMIDAGLALALATDFNPGSSPTGNMNFVLASACIKMAMTPEEAINAATINAAYAMGLSDTHGSITAGKKADLILTKKIPSYAFIPYSFGSNLIESVFLDGKQIG
jgi:imidazolonepropionase